MIDYRDRLAETPAHEVAISCIEAGIEAAQPRRVLRETVSVADGVLHVAGSEYRLADYDSVVVFGGGKAADVLAGELESMLGEWVDDGIVVATDPVEADRVDTVAGSHPVPDDDGRAAAAEILSRAEDADDGTLILVPITGGGSSLLPVPAGEVSLGGLRAVTADLIDSGAAIEEINAVRKHLSAIKGGGLAAAAGPATVVSLALSDVVEDDPGVIASGPTAPDDTTYAEALAVLDRYDVDAPDAVRAHLEAGADGAHAETPGQGDDVFETVHNHVLGTNWTAIAGAREAAAEAGYEPLVLSSRVRGEATEAALTHLAIAEEVRETGHPVEPPAAIISGGETTVSVLGGGRGGPNLEFALRIGVENSEGVVCASVDTDGADGSTDAAGAIVDATTVTDPPAARQALVENESYEALDERGALVYTGETDTNVNDLRVLVVTDE